MELSFCCRLYFLCVVFVVLCMYEKECMACNEQINGCDVCVCVCIV